jgi:hypothetical protein
MANPNSSALWLGLSNETDDGSSTFGYVTAQSIRTKALDNQLTRLENQDCINAYATPFQTKRGSVILVSVNSNITISEPAAERTLESVFVPASGGNCVAHPFQWICGGTMWDCNVGTTCAEDWQTVDATDWSPLGFKVSHCLSEDVDQLCRLQFNRDLAYVVIVFNVLKILVLGYVVFSIKENPLLTMGDAVTSFMVRPDNTTRDACLMSKDKLQEWSKPSLDSGRRGVAYDPIPKRWSTVASRTRWTACLVLWVLLHAVETR